MFSKLFFGGGGNKNQAVFSQTLCRQNPHPYFHRGCGTYACLTSEDKFKTMVTQLWVTWGNPLK